MPNAELAWKVLDLIEAHPKALAMDTWVNPDVTHRPERESLEWIVKKRTPVTLDALTGVTDETCGTTACFAGWTVALAGHSVTAAGVAYDREGKYVGHVETVAMDLLGIDEHEADLLFYVSTDENVRDTAAGIFGPRPA